MNEIEGTIVFEKHWNAMLRRMHYVSLIKEDDDFIYCDVWSKSIDKETKLDRYDVVVSDIRFNKSLFKYEEKYIEQLFHKDISGLISFDESDSIKELNQYKINRYKYIIHTGSSRSSKTYSIIDALDFYGRTNVNKRITAWRETKKDCKDTVLQDYLKRLKSTGRFERPQFNKTESIYHYQSEQNQSTFEVHGGDDEIKVHGLTQDIAWLNEPYGISEYTFNQIDQRTSDFLICDLNPREDHWSDDLKDKWNCITIYSTFKDNPFCPIEQRDKILNYEPWHPDDYTVKNGEIIWLVDKSKVRPHPTNLKPDIYHWLVYGLGLKSEKPHKIYSNWVKISDQQFDSIPAQSYFALDFGINHKTCLVEGKYFGEKFYIKERLYAEGRSIQSLPKELELIGITDTDEIACDSGNELNNQNIRDLREAGFYAIAITKGAGSVSSGINFVQRQDVNYTANSKGIEKEYELYQWKVDRYNKALEEPVKVKDDAMDAVRYLITYIKRELGLI